LKTNFSKINFLFINRKRKSYLLYQKKVHELEKKLLLYKEENLRKLHPHDPDLVYAVQFCMNLSLTYDQSIEQIKKFGFIINKKKFQRIKSDIKKEKIAMYVEIGTKRPTIQNSMGIIDFSMATLFEIVKNSKDNWQKLKAVKMILDCIIVQAKLLHLPNSCQKISLYS